MRPVEVGTVSLPPAFLPARCALKLAFHDADDTDTDFLAKILADTSDTRD